MDFLAFYEVALRHAQPPVVRTPADARGYVRHLLAFDPLGGLVAEVDGEVVGMAWLHARDRERIPTQASYPAEARPRR